MEPADVFPPPGCSLLRGLPKASVRQVTDADEEVSQLQSRCAQNAAHLVRLQTFLLYTLSPPAADTRGLGYCNGSSDILRVTIDLGDAPQAFNFEARDDESGEEAPPAKASKGKGRGAGARKVQARRVLTEIVLDVRQDVSTR